MRGDCAEIKIDLISHLDAHRVWSSPFKMERPAVPKFASFKPRPQVDSKPEPPSKEEARPKHYRWNEENRDKHKHRHHRRDRHGSHHDRHLEERRKKEIDRNRRSPTPPRAVSVDEFEESDFFIVDRRGDQKNVEFGSLHRYSVPAYRAFGKVLMSHHRESSSDAQRARRPLLDRSLKPSGKAKALRLRHSDPPAEYFGVEVDYIPLDTSSSRKRKRESESPVIDELDGHYRSIEGKAKPTIQPDDEDLEFVLESDVDGAEEALASTLRQANADLTRRTKEQPMDVSAWLDLVDFQDRLNSTADDSGTWDRSSRRTLADLRLSIYERALKHILPGKSGHDELRRGMLNEGASVWDSATLRSKWEDALNDCPSSLPLWLDYLEFVQTDSTSFSFSDCRVAYTRCLEALSNALPDQDPSTGHAMIYVYLRMTCFVRDAGYEELAFALWQALLEYHCFAPEQMPKSKEDIMAMWGDWWESDIPRIGEEGAQGWKHLFSEDSAHAKRQATNHRSTVAGNDRVLKDCLDQEAALLGPLHLPASTADEYGLEDPYRHVMFTDMHDMLAPMLNSISKHSLVNAFLCFNRLPPAHASDAGTSDTWLRDVLIQSPQSSTQGDPSHLVLGPEAQREASLSIQNMQYSAYDLFHQDVFPPLSAVGKNVARFVDRSLSSLFEHNHTDEDLAVYLLAFKARFFPEGVVKSAKRLLKTQPSNAALYNAYALSERKLGRPEKAVAVWQAALSGGVGHSGDDANPAIVLWHDWMLMLLENGREGEALGVLVAMADGPKTAATVASVGVADIPVAGRLKANRFLMEQIDYTLSNQRWTPALYYIDCVAWLTYILDDHALLSGLAVYQKHGAKLPAASAASEILHQAKARMASLHLRLKRPYKPSELRLVLNKSFEIHHENTVVLQTLAQLRGHTKLDSGLRDTITVTTPNKPGLALWLHRIVDKMRQCEAETATQESVHNLFKAALLDVDSTVAHSPILWKLWFDFECHMLRSTITAGNESQEAAKRAKTVFYDGMRYLPWQKAWVIEGSRALWELRVVDEEEVRSVIEILEERELRIRVQQLRTL